MELSEAVGGVDMKSSLEVRREREVQELLDRPRVMDFDKGNGSGGELHHRRVSDEVLSPTAVEGEEVSYEMR